MQIFKKVITITALFLLIFSCFLLAFPTISNFIRTTNNNALIEQFDLIVSANTTATANTDTKEDNTSIPDKGKEYVNPLNLEKLYKDSLIYNETIKKNQYELLTNVSYSTPVLNLSEYGIDSNMYGYISAPEIDMNLPIYLGANNQTMSFGAAHLTYTSLPIGGKNTNTVLAGHTGYVGQVFFDNIKKLSIGDTVTVTNYWGKLNYKVISYRTCTPTETTDIYITDGKDKLTLLTCVNDGKDRYILICERS